MNRVSLTLLLALVAMAAGALGVSCASRTPGPAADPQMRPQGQGWMCVTGRGHHCYRLEDHCWSYRRYLIGRGPLFGKLPTCRRRRTSECFTYRNRRPSKVAIRRGRCVGTVCRDCRWNLYRCEGARSWRKKRGELPSACTTWR